MLFRVGPLPRDAIPAAARFHASILPAIARQLDPAQAVGDLLLVFAPADHTHHAWRLAAVQSLARHYAPVRVNAAASDDEVAIAATHAYLAGAAGVTGQYLPLDSAGAGEVIEPES